jgi:membrane protein DedA with SNARE-associated domain
MSDKRRTYTTTEGSPEPEPFVFTQEMLEEARREAEKARCAAVSVRIVVPWYRTFGATGMGMLCIPAITFRDPFSVMGFVISAFLYMLGVSRTRLSAVAVEPDGGATP